MLAPAIRPLVDSAALAAKRNLEIDFPPWRVIITDRGNWWALRGPLPPDRMNEVDVLTAKTPVELRYLLAQHATG